MLFATFDRDLATELRVAGCVSGPDWGGEFTISAEMLRLGETVVGDCVTVDLPDPPAEGGRPGHTGEAFDQSDVDRGKGTSLPTEASEMPGRGAHR
ncbi:hypothetical protein ALI144C_02240 [Actinosynnema sp. ALI-1.44]|uniref:hypothetical protein n=1 Tax=Actinosynnema sp. ALI-1.44 TaxID=1933779 RepID=UPI00097C49FA|nr:hypothetical protein [Actinosynnema sp. ALI-1.44]ONI90797.1 hypothetical protein ALI144C_02240 [Actinosynnema sp. ALI-1.44]